MERCGHGVQLDVVVLMMRLCWRDVTGVYADRHAVKPGPLFPPFYSAPSFGLTSCNPTCCTTQQRQQEQGQQGRQAPHCTELAASHVERGSSSLGREVSPVDPGTPPLRRTAISVGMGVRGRPSVGSIAYHPAYHSFTTVDIPSTQQIPHDPGQHRRSRLAR